MAERLVTVREWERRRVRLSDVQADLLARASGGAVRLEKTPQAGEYDLVANALVGSVRAGGLTVSIRPKAPFANVLHLLGVADEEVRWWRHTFPYEDQPDLLPALLAFFARSTQRALAAGLLRDYRRVEEDLPTIRGQLDFNEIVARHGRVYPAPCVYDDHTADNRLNRFLRAAVREGLQWAGVPPKTRQLLRAELLRFDGVSDMPIPPDALDGHVWTRLDSHYETPTSLARLVLRRGTLHTDAAGTAADAFLIDMNKLFEGFVATSLRRRLRGRLDLHREPRKHLDHDDLVLLKPDLDFRAGGVSVYVGDVKYKLTDDASAGNADYYQLLAYTTAMRLPEGALIYCLADGELPPREIRVRGSGIGLQTFPLRVGGELRDLEASLDDLASWIGDRADRLVAA